MGMTFDELLFFFTTAIVFVAAPRSRLFSAWLTYCSPTTSLEGRGKLFSTTAFDDGFDAADGATYEDSVVAAVDDEDGVYWPNRAGYGISNPSREA